MILNLLENVLFMAFFQTLQLDRIMVPILQLEEMKVLFLPLILELWIHPSSSIFKYTPKFLIFNEVVSTKKQYMRDVVSIDLNWLIDIAPHYFEFKISKELDFLNKNF
jgi:hypothetical protein